MTGEMLSAAGGILLSLLFAYIPGLSDWYAAQTGTTKRLVMLATLLVLDASADPDPTSLALGTLELNAYRAQRLYLTALDESLKAESESRVIQWKFDRWDRVY